MTDELADYVERGRRLQKRMAYSPCEYIEVAIEAERHAVAVTGASRDDLRTAVQTMDAAEDWSDRKREVFIAWVDYLEERIEKR